MIRSYRYTLLALIFAGGWLLVAFVVEVDLFESLIDQLRTIDQYELDEFLVPAITVVIAVLVDASRRNSVSKIEVEKAEIYRAMVFSVHHIMNNFANQMQLFKMTADDTPGFDARVLALYDGVIQDAKTQIAALSSVTSIDADAITTSVKPQSSANPPV